MYEPNFENFNAMDYDGDFEYLQPSDGIEGKLILTNFASVDADIYCEAIRLFNEDNHFKLTEVFQIKNKAYDIFGKIVPNVNALYVTIGTSEELLTMFWKIYDEVKLKLRNNEELKSTFEEIGEYLEGIWNNGN